MDLENIIMVPLHKSDIDFIIESFDMLRRFLLSYSDFTEEDIHQFDVGVNFLKRLFSYDF